MSPGVGGRCVWLFQGHPQAGASRGDVGEELRQGFFLAQLLKMSSRLWRMIPSVIGGPGHKVTSDGHCLSPSVPSPWLEAFSSSELLAEVRAKVESRTITRAGVEMGEGQQSPHQGSLPSLVHREGLVHPL